jgi:hypothetical protein
VRKTSPWRANWLFLLFSGKVRQRHTTARCWTNVHRGLRVWIVGYSDPEVGRKISFSSQSPATTREKNSETIFEARAFSDPLKVPPLEVLHDTSNRKRTQNSG